MFPINNNLKVRRWVFSIPKRLRIYFLYDRKLLVKLSRCAWNVITAYLKSTVADDDAVPGASIAVQTPPATFIEIEPPHCPSDSVIEMEGRSGSKMRMCFSGKADPVLVDLGRLFLTEQT